MNREKTKAQIRAAKLAGAKLHKRNGMPRPTLSDVFGAMVLFALLVLFLNLTP